MSQQLLESEASFTQTGNQLGGVGEGDVLILHLIGVDGISMFVSVDHRQRDRHGVADKRYGHCVSGNVRKSAQSRQPRLGESGDVGGKSQVKHECVRTGFYFVFFSQI